MKRILLVGLLVGIALAVIGAEPVKVIMATTDDGRRVILMPDGKWNFVEGAPATPAPKPVQGCREDLWKEVVSYFSGWELGQIQKDSFTLQAGWKNLTFSSLNLMGNMPDDRGNFQNGNISYSHRVMVSVIINEDCTLTVNPKWEAYDKAEGWHDYKVGGGDAKLPFGGGKKVIEFDQKLRADLTALAEKVRPSPKSSP
jgi:hypothetical protein